MHPVRLAHDRKEVWSCGEAGIRHTHEGLWVAADVPKGSDLAAIAIGRKGDRWAVGARGLVLHERQGAWEIVPAGTEQDLRAVWVE